MTHVHKSLCIFIQVWGVHDIENLDCGLLLGLVLFIIPIGPVRLPSPCSHPWCWYTSTVSSWTYCFSLPILCITYLYSSMMMCFNLYVKYGTVDEVQVVNDSKRMFLFHYFSYLYSRVSSLLSCCSSSALSTVRRSLSRCSIRIALSSSLSPS